MIEVTITLDVQGRGVIRKPLGSLKIANDGTGTPRLGNYVIIQRNRKGGRMGVARIERWPRMKKSPAQLVAQAFKALGY